MEAVFPLVNWTGPMLDWMGPVSQWLTFLVDLNFLFVSFLLESLAWLLAFIYNLPHMVLSYLLYIGRVLFSLLALLDALIEFTLVGLQPLFTFLYGCYSSLDCLKLLGHLASQAALRSQEILTRGILNMVSSGHALLRQACDICGIAMSLVAYVINSLVNICLIGMLNLFPLVLALWTAGMRALWLTIEVLAAFFIHLFSSGEAMANLLWTPCQLGLELLASVILLLAGSMLSTLTIFVLLVCVMIVTLTVVYPASTLRLATLALNQLHARLAYHRLREDIVRFSRLALDLEAWHLVWRVSLQLANWPNRGGVPGPPQGGARRASSARIQGRDNLNEGEEDVRTIRTAPARGRERLNENEPRARQDPWRLLEELEARKRCVICQDQSKSVLLLPCRHLCLCRTCTHILMHQPLFVRNCPLCRRRILQTLNVYL
ncbi:E3 ubiquitin-protein ligase RNF26-like [Arvicola amphibius]|uniref:E3 ubiquitin-protein ligase RNF26-like n=1 Tax=Arvicola amphibius TaxID=1047088 RepID=UPI0018E2CA14|nr:E3 ubiquitin-protein ligase RNF26-like [Arvicola amphibius]